MKNFVVYAIATGEVLRSGTCQDADLERQANASLGEAVMEATADCIVVAEINLDPVRQALYQQIDAAAENVRLRFITPGAGQAITYIWKAQEAKAYLQDASAETPILTAEAAAVGTTVAALAAEVEAATQAWLNIGTKIEAARRAAKTEVAAASNIATMHAASQIDWDQVLA